MAVRFFPLYSLEELRSEKISNFVAANDYTKVVDLEEDHFYITRYEVRAAHFDNDSKHYLEVDSRVDQNEHGF